jgi:hypothetical protein
METLALWTRSEMIGSALDKLCFLVSGVGCQVSEKRPIMGVQNIPGSRFPELIVCSESQLLSENQRPEDINPNPQIPKSVTDDQFGIPLTPETRHLNTDQRRNRNHACHTLLGWTKAGPSGPGSLLFQVKSLVNQSVTNRRPTPWAIISGNFSSAARCCGVTPQAQNSGISSGSLGSLGGPGSSWKS